MEANSSPISRLMKHCFLLKRDCNGRCCGFATVTVSFIDSPFPDFNLAIELLGWFGVESGSFPA